MQSNYATKASKNPTKSKTSRTSAWPAGITIEFGILQ